MSGNKESIIENIFLPQDVPRVVGVSVIGPLHVMNGLPCQDACAFAVYPSGYSVIAVADGLGSASKSEIGARIAVDAALAKFREIVSKGSSEEIDLADAAREVVFYARKMLEEKSNELECKLRDLACTMIIAVLQKDNVVVAHVGDGAVIARMAEGLKLISGPEDSEYANEVSPLTGKDWELSLRFSPIIPKISGVMAFTDGCHRAALRKTQDGLAPFDGFCNPLFSYVKEVQDLKEAEEDFKGLLLSKKVCENSDDDKTLVIALLNTVQS